MWRGTFLMFLIFLVEESHQQSLQFLEAPSDALVAPNSTHTLTCNVSSTSPVTITWFKDDMTITFSGQHLISRNSGAELIITRVDRGTDEGRYYCEADSTSVGSVRSLGVMISVAYIDPPPPSVTPDISTVVVGNFSILSCSLPASVPAVTVRWYRQATDVLTLSNNRFYIYSNKTTSSLIISHFAVEDANTYDCEISNDLVPDMTYRSRIAAINAVNTNPIGALPHRFVVKPQDIIAVIGTTVRLQCFVIGQPVPRISWQKDNVNVSAMTEQSGRILIISDVQSSHAGVYTCISVQDGFEDITTSATLSIIVPPRITSGVQYIEALVGDTVQLSCMAEGSSPITWEWRHNTVAVGSDDHYSVNENQLNVTNGQRNLSGIYQCIACLSVGGQEIQDASNNYVNFTTKPPSFLPGGQPKDMLAISGSSVELMCNATGAPPPQYVWLKDRNVLDTSPPRFTLSENSGSLRIASLKKSDDGVYSCNVSNIVRVISSHFSVLNVLDKPNVLYKPANSTIVQNSSVTIPCGIDVSGVDVLDYFWLLNGRQLDSSSPQYMMKEGNITITNLQAEDEGVYKCLANLSLADSMANDLQFPVGSGIISVIFLPGIVDMLTVSEIKSRSVVLSWTFPSSNTASPSSHYIIEQRLFSLFGISPAQNDSMWIGVNTSNSLMSHVTSLHPYTGYQFRVTAVNLAGNGIPSLPSMVVVTDEAGPTAAPTMLSTRTRSESTELLVLWMAPLIRLSDGRGRNGIITNYSVIYQLDDSVQPSEMVVTNDNSTSLVLRGLLHSSVYNVMVAASTIVGTGPYTAAVPGRTLQRAPLPPDPPGMVSADIVNSTAVTLQWSEPPTTIPNITEYHIMYRHPARENDSDITIVLPAYQLNITIGGLDRGQVYFFNVSAVNLDGSSLPLVYMISTPGPPTRILTFNGTRLQTNAVYLSWNASPNGGSNLYGYRIEGYSIYERDWVLVAVLPANVTEYQLGASDGIIYSDFRISAFNQYGSSETVVFNVGRPVMPEVDAQDTLWFLVIFVLFGLFLIALGFLTVALIFRKCNRVYSFGRYSFRDTDDSEIASSVPSTATFSNYEIKSHKTTNIPLFSSETAPFSDISQPDEPSSRARSPMFSATDTGRSHLMAHGYPAPTSNPDGSTLTSGFSIDRPMFSDSTTVASGESSGPFGHNNKDYYHRGFSGQQITRQKTGDASTYL